MRTLLAILVLGLSATAIGSTYSSEVLVLASAPTLIPRSTYSSGFEVQNGGPYSIYCGLGSNPADGGQPLYPDAGAVVRVGKTREVKTDSPWSVGIQGNVPLWCIADTADQVTGAATKLTEAP